MLVWLITIGEPLLTDGENTRLLRTGLLADALEKRGHRVVWWTSDFDHTRKIPRRGKEDTINVSDNYSIKLLVGPSYRGNVSLGRHRNHKVIAKSFSVKILDEEQPDIIFSSIPIVELSREAVKYGKKHTVPVILDARDMWPDIILEQFPRIIKPIAKILLKSLYYATEYAFTNALAVTGITQKYVDWALKYANRDRTVYDRVFPLAYKKASINEDDLTKEINKWDKKGLNSQDFIISFFGNIGQLQKYELKKVIDAASILQGEVPKVKFIICGSGEGMSHYMEIAKGLDNVVFPGWINATEIWALMKISSLGLVPYANRKDFLASIPNKVIEYFSAGLPIISTLSGEVGRLINDKTVGVYCNSTDDIVKNIKTLIGNPDIRQEMSINAEKLYRESFDAEKIYSDLSDYLEDISKSGRSK